MAHRTSGAMRANASTPGDWKARQPSTPNDSAAPGRRRGLAPATSITSIDNDGQHAQPAAGPDGTLRRTPELVADVGSVAKSKREALDVAIRRANGCVAVEVRVVALHGARRAPTPRCLWVPLAHLRALRELLAEADRQAVELGWLGEAGR